ncbi:MAG: IS4 family transposase [Actinobacteria bacterium]|nr:IS4 family transposase [Actinomycetota bacterium]
MEDVFTSEELEATARETGFYRRKSKVNPSVFFDLLMYDMSSGKSKSLNQLSIEARSEHDIGVTKQGIDKKFNKHTLSFLRNLIEKQLSVESDLQIDAGWLSSFKRVTIKDGTRFNLPEEYKDYLPGSGGSGSKAGACLQFEFDLKSGHVIDLNLTASNKPDVKDALESLDNVKKNDLIIRDLGYYAFKSFINIIKKEAFFISRLGAKTNVFEMKSGSYKKLDFKAIYQKMKRGDLSRIYKDVFIGSEEKIPVRLVIELMPDDVYEQRMRKIRKLHKKKGYQTSEEYKFLARFNLFITNVPKKVLPDKVISSLYRMRWQIELIFKIWKSVFGIHQTRKMKYQRWLCLLYFKLLMMIVNWNIIMTQRNYLYRWKGKMLSLNKCFKTLFDNTYRLRETLRLGKKGIIKFIQWIDRILNENHWLERKKNTHGLEKIFYIMFCKSNVYVYI